MVLDVWLGSKSAGDPATGRLFTKEIWDRYHDTPNATRIQILLPNLKAADVEALERLDIPTGSSSPGVDAPTDSIVLGKPILWTVGG